MPRLAPVKASKKGSEELGDLIDSCSEIPELVCDGIVSMVKSGGTPHKLKQRIAVLQTMRAVSTEYRQHIDKFVLGTIQEVRDLAQVVWANKRSYEMANNRNEEASKVKDLKKKWDNSTAKLVATMTLYFPVEVINEYAAKINATSHGHQGRMAMDYTCLHASVSMFFAMATQTCYLHTCGGIKKCTKTHSGRSFIAVRFCGSDEKMYSKCIYSSEDCLCSLKEDPHSLAPGKMTQTSRMAVEMYRQRGIFEVSEIQYKMSTEARAAEGTSHGFKKLKLVLNHPDIDIPSTQKALEITPLELKQCKDEMKRKEEQRHRVADEMAAVQRRFLMEDVNNALEKNKKFGFKNFEALKEVFPGVAGAIRLSIENSSKDATCCWQVRVVAECFKEILFLMNKVRPVDKASANGMASREAYDFMSGKSCGVLSNVAGTYGWSCVVLGVQGMLTNSDKPSPANAIITMQSVCTALHLFDQIDGTWKVRINVPPGKASIYNTSGTKVFETELLEIRTRLDEVYYYDGVKEHVLKTFGEVLPDIPRWPRKPSDYTIPGLQFTDEVVKAFNAMFKTLVKRPQTKCLAMRYIGISPNSLCKFVSKTKNQAVLHEMGIAENTDAV